MIGSIKKQIKTHEWLTAVTVTVADLTLDKKLQEENQRFKNEKILKKIAKKTTGRIGERGVWKLISKNMPFQEILAIAKKLQNTANGTENQHTRKKQN